MLPGAYDLSAFIFHDISFKKKYYNSKYRNNFVYQQLIALVCFIWYFAIMHTKCKWLPVDVDFDMTSFQSIFGFFYRLLEKQLELHRNSRFQIWTFHLKLLYRYSFYCNRFEKSSSTNIVWLLTESYDFCPLLPETLT